MNTILLIMLQVWPMLLAMTALAVFTTYVFLQAPANYYIKFVLIPAAAFVWIFGVMGSFSGMGYAVPSRTPDKMEYLAHKIIIENNKKVGIEVWVDGETTRLLRIPYSKKMEKAMEEAQAKAGKGGKVVINKKLKDAGKEGQNEASGDDDDDYVSNLILPHEMNPKDIPPEVQERIDQMLRERQQEEQRNMI